MSDYKVVSLPVDGRWLFLCLVCMATETKNNIPDDKKWISHVSGIQEKRISLLLKMLHDLDVTTTKCIEMSQNVPTDRQTDVQTDRQTDNYSAFEKRTLADWNSFCDKNPILSKIKEMSNKRRRFLKNRFSKESFKDFAGILKAIQNQPFCLGKNDREWKISFDWLINNDTNYLKVLEGKYLDNKTNSNLQPTNPNCNLCDGTGFVYNQNKSYNEICSCRKKKAKGSTN